MTVNSRIALGRLVVAAALASSLCACTAKPIPSPRDADQPGLELGGTGPRVVRFAPPLVAADVIAQLEIPATPYPHLRGNDYVYWLTAAQADKLAGHGGVTVSAFTPNHRYHATSFEDGVNHRVVIDLFALAPTKIKKALPARITALGGQLDSHVQNTVIATVSKSVLEKLVGIAAIRWIEPKKL